MTLEETKEFAAIYHHKFVVLQYLVPIIQELIKRAETHDNSKFSEEEFRGLLSVLDEVRAHPFGTPEYDEMRKKHEKLFYTHYKKNRHHPEFHPNGIEDMDLVDLLELVVDWKAASLRNENPSVENSIKIGAEKYNIPPILMKVLMNTARNYKMLESTR